MQQLNPQEGKTKEIQIVAGLKVIETEYRVRSPIFEEIVVKVPKFIEEPIKLPTGFDTIADVIAEDIAEKVLQRVSSLIDSKLSLAIDERVKEIKVPKITEEVIMRYKDVEVERPIYRDREIVLDKVTLVDRQIINPILKDQEIINPIIIDKMVLNSIVTDINVTNAIVRDVEVERAVVREKVIEVVHKNCFDEKGNALL
jgi:hypothetical protein